MADTYTSAAKARLIEDMTRLGTWGPTINAQALELIDDMASGSEAINLGTSTSYAMAALSNGTDSESRASYLAFTGTPASAVTVTIPASVSNKRYLVYNDCGQRMTVKYAASTGVVLGDGDRCYLWCDGSEVYDQGPGSRITQAEIDAGVTPVNYAYKEGWARRYGALLDGVTDDTAALKVWLDFCIAANVEAVIDGDSLVDGIISGASSIASGGLYIRCIGDVTITVDPGATAFNTLIKCHTTAINSSVIRGGRLTLALNDKCATGIYLRHGGSDGGVVDWGPITVTDALNNNAADVEENAGLFIYGRYKHINVDNPIVDGVDRTNTTGGACKGISVSEVVGPVAIDHPNVARVLCTGSSADADGIAVFAYASGGQYAARAGMLSLISPVITDCQGRSIKTQVTESVILNPVIRRKSVVAFATSDIDHQVGGTHDLISPSFEYLKDGGVTPFASTFFPIGLQQQCTDRPNRFRISGGTLRTEAALPRLAYLTVGASSLAGEISIDGFEVQNVGALTTTTFTRAVFEFHAGQVQAATSTHIALRNIRGNFSDCGLLGYTDASAANTSKLSFSLVGNENTGADHADSDCFAGLSGTAINQVGGFNIRDNAGFLDYLGTWVFDTRALKAGCRFVYDRASSTVTNGPTISSGSYVTVECLGALTANFRNVRMTVDDANAANTVFYTQQGTWGTIK